jgi:hypothetical protein
MSRDGLVLIALAWAVDGPPAYVTATAAAAKGHLELHELGGGTVPAIEAVAKGQPVVILAGDTIVGGRQNRIINVSVWLRAGSVTSIPVSCLELGRWNAGTRFEAGRKVDYALRAEISGQIEEHTRLEHAALPTDGAAYPDQTPTYAADQGAIWSEINARQARASFQSPTSALHDLYKRDGAELVAFASAFPCPARAAGLGVALGGRLVALELFDSSATLAEQWPRLVEGAASADLDRRRAVAAGHAPKPLHRYPDEGALGRMLARARHAVETAVVGSSVGEGLDVRLRGEKVRGGALVVNDHPVHVELFRAEA